jgi:hypothetical protein
MFGRNPRLTQRARLEYWPNDSSSANAGLPNADLPLGFAPLNGAFVYRLGHGPLKAERRVRFPYALPAFGEHFPPRLYCKL